MICTLLTSCQVVSICKFPLYKKMPWECFDIVSTLALKSSESNVGSVSKFCGWFSTQSIQFIFSPIKYLILTLLTTALLTLCKWAPSVSQLWYSSRGYLMVSKLLHKHFSPCADIGFHLMSPCNVNNSWQTSWDYTLCLKWEGCLPKIIGLIVLAGPVRI